ncbi:hypothetical protein ABIB85_008307 [Bradyrhizobium sp. JR1.5]|uniref:hypothetical protein n=1 Tax=unclassified Bradyrhizobium TaxID=2631580 RepID=UPI0033932BE7
MVGPSTSRQPMSHKKTDLGIPRSLNSAKVVLGTRLITAIVAARPQYRTFVDGLHAVGILQLSSHEFLGA